MNAPARIAPPRTARIRLDETDQQRAHRATISVHCPNQDEMQMAARVDLATMRDQALAGQSRCCDEAAGLLHEVVRLATPAVYAPWPASRLIRLKGALGLAMEAARGIERIAADGGR